MDVFIITEGNPDIGFGHITRCISLYQAFAEKGINVKFIVNSDNSSNELLTDKEHIIFNWLNERERLINIIRERDVAITDSYLAGSELYKEISKNIKVPVYIDDYKRIDYPKGIVVNSNIDAEILNYPDKKDIVYLLGNRYIPLRKEFWFVPRKKINKNLESVMVTFGGSDIRDLTPKVLEVLVNDYPALYKNVIIGKGFKNIEKIEAISDKRTNLIYYPDAEGMKNTMFESDIAISAGGQTLNELIRTGVPSIVVTVANNQMNNVKEWQRIDLIRYAGRWDNTLILLNNIKKHLERIQDRILRENVSMKGSVLIDGHGAQRIVEEILKEVASK